MKKEQNLLLLTVFGSFFMDLDPDSGKKSDPDPDPKHWLIFGVFESRRRKTATNEYRYNHVHKDYGFAHR